MANAQPLTDLIKRWQHGDRQAGEELFAHYSRRLVRVAERHLSRKVARREGGEDVVQSVMRTFFRRCQEGGFQINRPSGLWRLLVTITVQKVRAKGRYHSAGRRDVAAEDEDDAWLTLAATHEPGPAEVATLEDLINAMLLGLGPLHGRVLELLLQGHTVAEVAQQLGRTRQSVYRIREMLQRRLKDAGGAA